jgi:hydroxylamine reductase (hybrid-cluster protein)
MRPQVSQILPAFSRPARKNATNRNLLRQNFIAYIFRSKRARERKRTRTRKQEREKEQEQESKREKKNGKTPSLLRRIILRLGRITP